MLKRFIVLIAFLLALTASQTASAQKNYLSDEDDTEVVAETPVAVPFSRAFDWEVFGEAGYVFSSSHTENSLPNVGDVRPNGAGGIGVGYNVGPFVNLNVDVTAGPARFTKAEFNQAFGFFTEDRENGYMTTIMFNVEAYPFRGPITPLLSVGAGAINVSRDFIGYSSSDSSFAYGIGGGLRWEFDDHLFAKVIYRANFTKFDGADETSMFHSVFLSLGFMY
jgi:opacity protein-like surface antigen